MGTWHSRSKPGVADLAATRFPLSEVIVCLQQLSGLDCNAATLRLAALGRGRTGQETAGPGAHLDVSIRLGVVSVSVSENGSAHNPYAPRLPDLRFVLPEGYLGSRMSMSDSRLVFGGSRGGFGRLREVIGRRWRSGRAAAAGDVVS